jgi:hypothetical protein
MVTPLGAGGSVDFAEIVEIVETAKLLELLICRKLILD